MNRRQIDEIKFNAIKINQINEFLKCIVSPVIDVYKYSFDNKRIFIST